MKKPFFVRVNPPSGKFIDEIHFYTQVYGHIVHWTEINAYKRYIKEIIYE